ncbi:MAG: SDR family NAD(P)-dependent oxidoreductase [Pseudorhodoplanes sp.]
MMARIEGSVCFVTGAAGGIGAGMVDGLLRRGAAKIYAADRAFVGGVRPSGWSEAVDCLNLDIADYRAVGEVSETASDVNFLFNIAGVNLRSTFLAENALETARSEMEINYFGTLAVCRAFAPHLVANAKSRPSAIVNMLSILSKVTLPNLGTYCASKAALLRMSEGLRAELADRSVAVIAVMPWAVDTAISRAFSGPKSTTAEVAERTLDGIEQGLDEVYLHEFSDEVNRRLREDPKGLERELSARFRSAP